MMSEWTASIATVLTPLVGSALVAAELADRAETIELRAGDLLPADWSTGSALAVVVDGRLVDEHVDRILERGDLLEVGAGALRALRGSTLARISVDSIGHVLAADADCLGSLVGHLLRRSTGSQPSVHPAPRRVPVGRLVTIVALDGLDVGALASGICSAPEVAGTLQWLPMAATVTGTDRAAVDTTLDRLTARPGTTLIAADPAGGRATQRCIERAELVLVAVGEDAGPNTLAAAGAVADHAAPDARVWLVPVRGAHSDRPRNGARLRHAVPRVDELHHVAEGHRGDLHRLGRLVAGVGVGLVLSGGGARGFGHIGVFRALDELAVPVDRVVGSSIGSVMGALLAKGLDVDEIPATCEEGFSRLLDYTMPTFSMLRGRRITRALDTHFGDWDIDDMPIPFACTSTNLTRSLLEVHRTGSSAFALRASVAIPGVLPPVPRGDDLLVDGGVLNNLPVDLTADDPSIGTTIAVDVTPPMGPRAREAQPVHLSGWSVVRGRFRPRTHRPAGLVPVLMRSLMVGAARDRDRHVRAGAADLVVPLDLRGVGLLAFGTVTPVIDRGYEQALPIITQWLAARGDDRSLSGDLTQIDEKRNHALSHVA